MRVKQTLLAFLTVSLVIPAALQLAGRIGLTFALTGPLIKIAIAWKAFVNQIGRAFLDLGFRWLDWHPSENQVEGICLSVLLLTASGGPVLRAWVLGQKRRDPRDDPPWVDDVFALGTIAVFMSFALPMLFALGRLMPPGPIEDPWLTFGVPFERGLVYSVITGVFALAGLAGGLFYLGQARRNPGDRWRWWRTFGGAFTLLCGTAVLFVYVPGDITAADIPRGGVALTILVPLAVTAALVASAFLDALAMARVSLGMAATLLANYVFALMTS